MLSRSASKFVWCSGRSGRSFSVAALASNTKRNDNENDKDDDSTNHGSLKGKRVPKSQRRAMVEVFVNEYKAKNNGKLPCVSILSKEIGGSFYVLKNILQELELQLTMPALDQNASPEKDAVREDRRSSSSSSSSAKKSFSVVFRDDCSENLEADNKNDFDSIRYKHGTDKAEVSDMSTTPANLVEEQFEFRQKDGLDSKESTSLRMEAERVSDIGLEDVEDGEQKRAISEDLRERDISKDKTGHDEQTSVHEPSAPTSVAEKDPEESTLWVNIKSFANGFMKLWRKS